MRFLSMKEVCAIFGVSRSTIDRWEDEAGFPRRTELGKVKPFRRAGRHIRSNCHIGFWDEEVLRWAQARMDERRPPSSDEGDDETPKLKKSVPLLLLARKASDEK